MNEPLTVGYSVHLGALENALCRVKQCRRAVEDANAAIVEKQRALIAATAELESVCRDIGKGRGRNA